MGLPMLKKCCFCVSLELGCVILAVISTAACILIIVGGAINLPQHNLRPPEDNLISMSMVMFATLAAISNLILLLGMHLNRSGYVQLSLLFNLLFMIFGFLIAVVTCLFSPEFKTHIGHSALSVSLSIIALIVGAGYCFYYALVMNSVYRKMKMDYSSSAIPV